MLEECKNRDTKFIKKYHIQNTWTFANICWLLFDKILIEPLDEI